MTNVQLASLDDYLLKPDWIKPPCWRWTLIVRQLANLAKTVHQITKDSVLIEGSRFYQDKTVNKISDKLCAKKYPEMKLAYDLFQKSEPGGWRWYIEGLLMAGLKDAEIKDTLKIDIPKDAIRIFRGLYFDIDSYRESELAVMANVISAARNTMNVENDCDFLWKHFAYVWGPEPFIQMFGSRRTEVKRDYLRWLKGQVRADISAFSFRCTSNLRTLHGEDVREVLKLAKDFWVMPEGEVNVIADQAAQENLAEIFKHIDFTIASSEGPKLAIEPRAFPDLSEKTA
jgi:hypothetical protein